jgi:hypothetical protein
MVRSTLAYDSNSSCSDPIEDGTTDGDCRFLGPERSCPQSVTDDGFVAADRGLNERALAVAGRSLPFHPAVFLDRRDMPVPLAERFGICPLDCVCTRRYDDRCTAAMVGDGPLGWLAVIGAIGCEPADVSIALVEQRLHLRGISSVLIGHDVSNDFTAVGIQRQMQLSPASPGLAPGFSSSHCPAP